VGVAAAHPDFFISRTGADKGAAGLIADIIREAGLTPFYQDEHFGHADFMRRMEQGYECSKLIALLSADYQKSEHCRVEYNHHLGKDPANLKGRLVVLRIANCQPEGSLQNLAYTDLVPVLNDVAALRRVVRVALGIDQRPTEAAFVQAYQRAGQQIRHPNIREVKGFTGRGDMLDALAQKLAAKSAVAIRNSSQTTLAMRGMGGVGKTVLAQEYAWRNRERYCGVWWVRAEKPEILVDDLAALGARFIPALPDKPEEAALKTVDQLAQMRSGKPWLLIYDNAEGPALLRKFTPAENAHVLITTRRTDWHGEADEELAVDVFDRDTAIAYLMKHAAGGGAEAAGRLADALHCLPLALSHARAYCRARNWSFDRYIEKLPELIAEAPKDAPYPASVFATFSLAIEKAALECADAETLMALLAFFAPDKIPLWLIPEDVLSEKQRDDALAALTSVSLAAHDTLPDGAPAISVHRLVQEVMRGRLRKSGRFEDAAALAIRALYQGYDESADTIAEYNRRAAWLPHAVAAMDHAPRDGEAASQTVWVCIFAGDFRRNRGDLSSALHAYDFGKKIAEAPAHSQPDNAQWQRDLSAVYSRVDNVLVAQGNLEGALNAFRDGLSFFERLAKADPQNAQWQRDLYVSYIKVGAVLKDQGNLPDALKAFRDGLPIAERFAKADPQNAQWQRGLFVSYIKVGEVLKDQGNLPDALKAFRDSLRIAERLAKADPHNAQWQYDFGISNERIGNVQVAQGDLLAALKSYEAKRDIISRLAAADPHNAQWQRDLSVSYNKVSDVLAARGKLPDALKVFRDSLAIFERLSAADPQNAE